VVRDEIPEAEGPESHPTVGMALALQAVDSTVDDDLGGAKELV